MNSTTMTQMTGAAPVAARRRAVVCVPAYLTTRHSNLTTLHMGGFWGSGVVGHTIATKRPTRHLAPRPT